MGKTNGRSTVYNDITSDEKLKQVNEDNIELENDFIEYLTATDKSKNTIKQYTNNLHIIWCWSLDFNKNKAFVDFTKREITKFQNHALNVWGWSPSRLRTVKATARSLENYIENMLDDEFPDYRAIWNKIENPVNEPVREKSVFTIADLQPLLDYLVEKKQFKRACILALAMYSGRRKAELCRFKVSYFDEENLICGGTLYQTPEKMVTKGRGSKGKLLTVYTLAKPFQPYLNMWMIERRRLGIESEWLFPDKDNYEECMDISIIDNMYDSFSKFLKKPFYAHALRHSFTTYLLEQNLPESVVQKVLGWSTIDLVSVYDDRSDDNLLEQYFGDGGIKQTEKKSLNDL
jgi:integrase